MKTTTISNMAFVLVICVLLASTAQAEFIVTDSNHLDITGSYTTGVLLDSSTVDILAGGYVSYAYVNNAALLSLRRPTGSAVGAARVYNNGRLEIHSGTISNLYTYNAGNATINGGGVGGNTMLYDSSRLVVNGGSSAWIYAYDTSSVLFNGGSASSLSANGTSSMVISGGVVSYVYGNVDSSIIISGGSIYSLSAGNNSNIVIHGTDFQAGGGLSLLQYDTINGIAQYRVQNTGVLTGKWADGTSWAINIGSNQAGATISAIPEPATLSLVGLGISTLLLRRRARR